MLRSSLKEFESSDMAAGIELEFLRLEINLQILLELVKEYCSTREDS